LSETQVTLVWRRGIAALLLAASIVLVGFPESAAKYTGYDALSEHAMRLIDESLERDKKPFLVITAIKTSLAVIEGSGVGVGFDLKVGDVVQAPYDYVNFFWEMFLYAFLILGTYKLLIETGMLTLGLRVIGLGLAVVAAALATNAKSGIWRWGRRALLGGALFAYAVPVALVATHALSERYTARIKEQHLESIRSLGAELDKSEEDFIALEDQIDALHPVATLKNLQDRMLGIARSIGETFERTLSAFLYFMLVIAFEVVFFPFLSAYMLYKVGHFVLDRGTIAAMIERSRPDSR